MPTLLKCKHLEHFEPLLSLASLAGMAATTSFLILRIAFRVLQITYMVGPCPVLQIAFLILRFTSPFFRLISLILPVALHTLRTASLEHALSNLTSRSNSLLILPNVLRQRYLPPEKRTIEAKFPTQTFDWRLFGGE
jgi:hypothetical protein